VVWGWSGCGFQVESVQGDDVAEGFEDADGAASGVVGVLAGVVVAAEVVVGNLMGGHVPGGDQDRGFDGDQGA
jgi:hypothetical protein